MSARAAAVLLAALLACAPGEEQKQDTYGGTAAAARDGLLSGGAGRAAPHEVRSGAAPSDTVPAFEGTWDAAEAVVALRTAGLQPQRAGEVRQPFLSVPGALVQIRGGEVQVYVYGDAVALARDTDRLDTTTVSPPNMQITWRRPASLVVSNNLAAIVLTGDAEVRRAARRALTLQPSQIDQP